MSKMPDYKAIIIFGSKKLWETFRTVRYYTGQPAVKKWMWPKQEGKENESDKNIMKQFTEVWRSNSTEAYPASKTRNDS